MKASKVLLRWYKSFNVNYMNYSDRQHGVVPRPWNSLHVEGGSETDFEFIEIPIEGDITTIVGANESGKSHLLSAISKVIKGTGIPDEWGDGRAFGLTDLCHYASVRSKNSTVWPNIGMEFSGLTAAEQQSVAKAAGAKGASPNFGERACFTLVVAPNNAEAKAYLYIGNGPEPLELDHAGLTAVRRVLPKVKFIQSKVDIADHVPISDLLAEMGGSAPPSEEYFRFVAAQAAAKFLKGLSLAANSQVSAEVAKELADIQGQLGKKDSGNGSAVLETLLFQDVLGITLR